MTGTEECLARSWISEWGPTLATMEETIEDMTTEVSCRDSLTPSWISSLPRNIGCPPIAATAPSVEIRVLVLRLLNESATDLPANVPRTELGIEPDLITCLCK